MKIIATYKTSNGNQRDVIIDVPEVKSLFPSKRQLDLCEAKVNIERREGEEIVNWRLVNNQLRGL